MKIRDILILSGVSEKQVAREIYSKIFPWYARIFASIGLLFGGDPFTAEYQFVLELADCSSGEDIDECFFSYRTDANRIGRIIGKISGLSPRPHRVFAFYKHLKAPKL